MSAESRTGETVARCSSSPPVGHAGGRYLLAIHWVSDAGSDSVSTGELRRSLDVSGPSVSEMIAKLADQGFVEYEKYSGVRLTPRGQDRATNLAREFCVVTTFFESVLGTDLDDETAYEISVRLPSDGVARLREITDAACIPECPAPTGESTECPG